MAIGRRVECSARLRCRRTSRRFTARVATGPPARRSERTGWSGSLKREESAGPRPYFSSVTICFTLTADHTFVKCIQPTSSGRRTTATSRFTQSHGQA
ncbi:unnamed protein product [Protopolystoma xenopodis]|uniref:Uncharacterized protein n=1 Tax=Protopolystoma xenopodis TaxID=117903 RepID=A0A3S5B1V4_9PLAT|nr:unnamed protein product [Protopolystoma xenopodis]